MTFAKHMYEFFQLPISHDILSIKQKVFQSLESNTSVFLCAYYEAIYGSRSYIPLLSLLYQRFSIGTRQKQKNTAQLITIQC